ncbi:helix-turn-helix transcriptional regulator [Pseudogracilibacillus sp. SO30301A]|uniref:helix-turn-helix transcriptional regulator n=1 Tax=Pseudogracilibacillus sp. SO30301A TaxID=3098291 RepID=UPI00300DF7AD
MKNCIKELRAEKQLTQEQLSKKVGVSRQSIVAIESGKYNPSLELAFKIAQQFNRTIEEVFLFEGGRDK